jgi:hypothetical protein
MRVISMDSEANGSMKPIEFDARDLREIFGLFTSCTEFERAQVYDPSDPHFFANTELAEDYTLTAEKQEFARDALRAVLSFLHARGYALTDGRSLIDLSFVEEEFIQPGHP